MKSIIFMAAGIAALGNATAAPLKTAVVTTVVNDVRLSEKSAEARSVATGQKMSGSSTLLTGRQSRAAMTFPDRTVTRIGANSVFRFSSGSRNMEIEKGSFLLQVPKNAGGATIRTATVTAAITGTTTMMEFSPGQWIKFVCLEGKAKLSNRNGKTVEIPAGQMMVMHPDAANFPRPMIVNVGKMMKTSALADDATFGELSPEAQAAIEETEQQQMAERRVGSLLPAGLINRLPKREEQGESRSLTSEIFHGSDQSSSHPGSESPGGGQSGGIPDPIEPPGSPFTGG